MLLVWERFLQGIGGGLSGCGVGGLGCDGQIDGEGAAFIDFAFDVDSAIVPDNDFLDDGKAEACALDLLAGSVDAIEPAENFGQVIFGYSHTGIGDL